MTHTRNLKLFTLLLLISGCVTVNVYFPAAAAEQAADRIIKEIYGDRLEDAQPTAPEPDDRSLNETSSGNHLGINLLDLLIPAAHAQEANMDISTPAVNRLKTSMTQRHPQLEPYYRSGAIGMDNNGLITLRDPTAVSIRDRNTVNQLVAAENQDRNALYTEIARANSHPEWEAQIRNTFARRWVANAPAGWYFQDGSGSWKQK